MRYSKRRLDSSANERCREEVIADQVKSMEGEKIYRLLPLLYTAIVYI